MKPVITFNRASDRWYKIGICIIAATLLIGGIVKVVSVFHNIVLLYQCEKLVQTRERKQHNQEKKESVEVIKKGVLEHLSIKQKYERMLNNAYQLCHWYFFIHDAVTNMITLEQLSISKTTISCSLTSVQMRDIQNVIVALSENPDFAKVTLQSCQTRESDHSSVCMLHITVKNKKRT